MAILNENFINDRFFRPPLTYRLPIPREGSYIHDGEIVDDEQIVREKLLKVPDTDEESYRGENTDGDETFEVTLLQNDVYARVIVHELYDFPCFNLVIRAPEANIKIMSDRDYFSPMFPNDVKTLAFDFKKFLRKSETLDGTVWTSELEYGDDPNPELFIQDSPEVVGTESRCRVGNGQLDNIYRLTGEVTTSDNNMHTLVGFVAVRDIE